MEPFELAELVRRVSWAGCDPGLLGPGCAARVCSWRRLEADMVRIEGDGGDKRWEAGGELQGLLSGRSV